MNCVIIDDESLAIDILVNYVDQTQGLKLLKSFENAFEALYYVQTQHVDLVFLDIQMPMINGLQFIKILKNRPKIIITTAYKEFAIEAFENSVVDYLLKPIPYERFLEAVSKAFEAPSLIPEPLPISNAIQEKKYFYIKEHGKYVRIYEEDIRFLHGDRNYCTFYLKTEKKNVKGNLSYFGNKFSDERFMRVHKSYVVSLASIEKYDSESLWISDDCIPIGRTYKKTLFKYLEKKTL